MASDRYPVSVNDRLAALTEREFRTLVPPEVSESLPRPLVRHEMTFLELLPAAAGARIVPSRHATGGQRQGCLGRRHPFGEGPTAVTWTGGVANAFANTSIAFLSITS